MEREVSDYLNQRTDIVDEGGRQLDDRNGPLSAREILTGIGPVTVRQPRLRDKRHPVDGECFTPGILPRYLRKTKGCGSAKASLTMMFKLAQSASKGWKNHHIPDLIRGVKFIAGVNEHQLRKEAMKPSQNRTIQTENLA